MHFERGPFLLQLIEQWSQFFQRCNWYTFEFAGIHIEHDVFLGDVEIRFVVLGLGFRLSYNFAETEGRQEIMRRAAEVQTMLEDKQ